MSLMLLIISFSFTLDLQSSQMHSEPLLFLSNLMPQNITKNDSLKTIAKKAYKNSFSKNNANSNNDFKYEIENVLDLQIKTGLLFENLKVLLNSNLAKGEMTYSAIENKVNMKLYQNINNNIELSLSEEKHFSSDLEILLFNLSYKF